MDVTRKNIIYKISQFYILMNWLGSKQFVYKRCECLEWPLECMAWIDYCLLHQRTLIALGYNTYRMKSYKRKTKHIINTNAQFVILNNNKLYTLLNQIYWNLPWKFTSVY